MKSQQEMMVIHMIMIKIMRWNTKWLISTITYMAGEEDIMDNQESEIYKLYNGFLRKLKFRKTQNSKLKSNQTVIRVLPVVKNIPSYQQLMAKCIIQETKLKSASQIQTPTVKTRMNTKIKARSSKKNSSSISILIASVFTKA